MQSRIFSLVFLFSVVVQVVVAQTQPCGTDVQYQKLLLRYPMLANYEQQFRDQLSARIGARTTTTPDTTIYDVPVVVHVIHDYGAENVSDNALFEAASYWAITYMKENSDTADVIPPFKKYVGNPRIRLHLATIDPSGKPTKGIVRVQSYLSNLGDDQAKYAQWPQDQYVNIWLIGTFGADIGVGTIAYALLPDMVPYEPYYDGVICLASATDSSTKTIPHEIGHVFNLLHPWGNTNSPAVACGDDGVDDTPPTMGHWNYGCVASTLYDTTCATGYMVTYLSSDGTVDSVVDYPDTVNSQNIMDYTDCQKMFTIQQAYRMRTALTDATAGRNNLYSPANLASTGALLPRPDLAPIADFIVNKTNVGTFEKRNYYMAVNGIGSFMFQNESWNDTISNVSWTFSNGATTPTSTSMTTVANKFTQPGWVTVTLTAHSNAGTDSIVNTQAVYVADSVPVGVTSYTQDFTNDSAISNWPMFNYYHNQFKWQYYPNGGLGGNGCIEYRSFDTSQRIFGTATGDYDDFFTPAFDLSAATTPVNLDFFTAGAFTNHNVSGYDPRREDSLEIDASITGGVRWQHLASFYGSDLANNGGSNSEFILSASSTWKARTVPVPSAYFTNQTYFRFRYWPGNLGNNMYLDKFSLSPYPAEVKEVLSPAGIFDVYPNPAQSTFHLVFKTGNSGSVSYHIMDITGKTVLAYQGNYPTNTVQDVSVDRSAIPAAGIYFVTVVSDGNTATHKLVIY